MGYRSIISLMPKSSVDADAQAFLTAAAITDPTISGAINTLVVQMKADNIWNKMKAVYPMVGGTANSHKFNLKDPRDLDAAFRLLFAGGWTHSANGALPNGTNGYANTFFNPRTHLTIGSNSQGQYQTLNQVDSGARGVWDSGTTYRFEFCSISSIYANQARTLANGADILGSSFPDTRGLVVSKTSSSRFKFMRNSAVLGDVSAGSALYPNINYYIAALNNNGSANFFSNMQFSFFFLGEGLSDTEVSNLYTAVQTFQTALSRQV